MVVDMYSKIESYIYICIYARCTIIIGPIQTNSRQAFLWYDKVCGILCSLGPHSRVYSNGALENNIIKPCKIPTQAFVLPPPQPCLQGFGLQPFWRPPPCRRPRIQTCCRSRGRFAVTVGERVTISTCGVCSPGLSSSENGIHVKYTSRSYGKRVDYEKHGHLQRCRDGNAWSAKPAGSAVSNGIGAT